MVEQENAGASVVFRDVAQVAFTVPKLKEAKEFYRDALELKHLFDAGTMSFFQCGQVRIMVGEGEGLSPAGGHDCILPSG